MIPGHFYIKVGEALNSAMERGVSFTDELNRQGLLLTEVQEKAIREGVLNVISLVIDRERPEDILRWHFGDSSPRTAAQMWEATQHWLEDFIERQRG